MDSNSPFLSLTFVAAIFIVAMIGLHLLQA